MLASIFLTAIAQKPIVRDYPYYLFKEMECQGFAYAHENDLLAISYNPDNEWSEKEYAIEMQLLDEEEGNFIAEQVTVLHIGQKEHLSIHEEWLKRKVKIREANLLTAIKNGKDLWEQRENIFPHLVFCNDVEKQLTTLSMNDENLANSVRKLLILNEYLANLQGNECNYAKAGLTVTGESKSTLNNSKLWSERTFLCSDGERRFFELHIKLTNWWRIYIYQIPNENKHWIGYIGKHLRT